jgi:anti-sigma factor RsiW
MSVVCEIAAPFVANSAVERGEVIRPLRAHTDSCLKCQARHAAMTRTARELEMVARGTAAAPMDLEWKVMSSLDGELAVVRSIKAPVALVAAGLSLAAALVIWRLKPKVRT